MNFKEWFLNEGYSPGAEYWIVNGRVIFDQYGSGGEDDYLGVHHQLAIEYLSERFAPCLLSFAQNLGLQADKSLIKRSIGGASDHVVSRLRARSDNTFQYNHAPETQIYSLLMFIKEKLSNKTWKQVWEKINQQCPDLDYEGFSVLGSNVIADNRYFSHEFPKDHMNLPRGEDYDLTDPKYYLMKKDGWILWRNSHIELYGFNRSKFDQIKTALPQIFEKENKLGKHGRLGKSEDWIEIYDHHNKRTMEYQLKDFIEDNITRPKSFIPERPNINLPPITGKEYGRELWRGTSE